MSDVGAAGNIETRRQAGAEAGERVIIQWPEGGQGMEEDQQKRSNQSGKSEG